MTIKNEIQISFEANLHNLENLTFGYRKELEHLRKIIDTFLDSDTYEDILFPIKTLAEELSIQEKILDERQKFIKFLSLKTIDSLAHFGECDFCNNIYADVYLRQAPEPFEYKQICDDCFDDEFFDCHRCKKVLPASQQGEEDREKGYGWICKDCCKPIGFPNEVLICPEYCENSACSDIFALRNTYNGSFPLEERDCIKLEFVKQISKYWALYKSESGHLYEISELDCWGKGSMEEVEDEE